MIAAVRRALHCATTGQPVYHARLVNLANRLSSCILKAKPAPCSAWYIPEKQRLETRKGLPGANGVMKDPVGGKLVGTFKHPYPYADMKADIAATIEARPDQQVAA